jgi:TPP-dependent pyruvate/acetoin dehydrogenase alpha subunit
MRAMDLSAAKKTVIFKRMLLIRRFEEKVKELYDRGRIVGAIHLYIGQEAVAVGVCQVLWKRDYVFSTHRGHGHAIAKGCDLGRMMAELMGRETGLSRGHGGSMHLFDPGRGLMGGNGIVGAGIPLALGAAFSAQYRETDQVAVAFFSDGAANQGVFAESLNLAALFHLPVVLVCENNRYAATTPIKLSFAREAIAERAESYGVPAAAVDGNDVIAVRRAAASAVRRARRGNGPSFIECRTYRVEPHCGIIPDEREKGERESWRARDPIALFRARLTADRVMTPAAVVELEKDISRRLEKAVEFAEKSPWPDPEAPRHKTCLV